uniref:CAZy families GH38 protein n=1 Tax=uncultured Roseiflexus sp. TaxID=290602 RepID=A0A060BMZ2_9CHLR|nr:CAZy families GH38 protein [uncultured Roseiflexus sp.]
MFGIDSLNIHVTCVKQAEDGSDLIVRMFNPGDQEENVQLAFGRPISSAVLVRMDESEIEQLEIENRKIKLNVKGHKIVTVKIGVEK